MAVIQRYNPLHLPPGTIALLAVIGIVTVSDIATGGAIERTFLQRGIDVHYGEYWRLLTSGLVHADLLHLGFNAFGLYILGTTLERYHGWKPVVAVFVAGVFCGSALSLVFLDTATPGLGASGGTYALLGAVLGVLYVKTGSLRGITQVPMGMTLLIWLGIGVYISLRPGIGFLAHAGGFAVGTVLGIFIEHRYRRDADIYHKLTVGLVLAAAVLLAVFGSAPVTRAAWPAIQSLRAYKRGDMLRGDKLLEQARKRGTTDEGTIRLIRHLQIWRQGNLGNPDEFNDEILRLPLMHTQGIPSSTGAPVRMRDGRPVPFNFLTPEQVTFPVDDAAPLESNGDAQ